MISIPLAVILILFGIVAFMIPFHYGVISSRFKANIDNSIFRLHYRLTLGFLLSISIFLAATTLIEEPLDEITDGDRIWNVMVNSCVINTKLNSSEINLGKTYEITHGLNETIYERKPALMYYYQALTLSLFVQAVLFFLPYKVWTVIESGVTQSMITIYHSGTQKTEYGITTGRERLVNHLLIVFNAMPNKWFYCYVVAEIFNFLNVVGQIFFINGLFNGRFGDEDLPLFRSNLSNWEVECNHVVHLPLSNLKTKCFFESEFVPGDIRQFDATCKFPRTLMDEKFYMFLSFWLIYIAALSGSVLVCRFLTLISPRVRSFWTRSRVRLSHPECYDFIFRKSTIGDWFLFDMLCKNLEPEEFNDVVNDFAKKLEGKKFRKPIDNYI